MNSNSHNNCAIHKAQNGNEIEREALLLTHTEFIRRIGSRVCGRRLDFHDDEMSICLIAFNQALDSYKHETKVPFKSYAAVVIRNKVIDYLRKENRHRHLPLEISNDNIEEDTYSPAEIREAVKIYQSDSDEELRKYEIVQLGNLLQRFDITWNDLLEYCPKHQRKRVLCLKAAGILVSDDEMWEYFWRNKMVPIKKLTQELNVSRKTIERSRKYIAATAVLIKYKEEFILLYEYIKDELERG
ncbi:MAG: hypothetical protein APF76_15490 [Desulfitibacter sp. BRH_c19]|nr:MAG: hypothetical protein APF76_15490 [Desulfitibacter sp. BRH_c19]